MFVLVCFAGQMPSGWEEEEARCAVMAAAGFSSCRGSMASSWLCNVCGFSCRGVDWTQLGQISSPDEPSCGPISVEGGAGKAAGERAVQSGVAADTTGSLDHLVKRPPFHQR